VSSYWRSGREIGVDFLPEAEPGWLLAAKRERPRAGFRTVLGSMLPARLAETLGDKLGIEGELANLPDRRLAEAEARLRGWRFSPSGTEGFAKAEVTAGGISTEGLSSKTMEAKKVPGLFAIGEAVDVTGWLGGYNFQWAWASGWAAGQSL
jgi:predicted Rossmann fold flavoprotein